ncbi:UNVERIFIED_CONTAM: hypothetical protein Sradi_4120000 [Sesamum radiatum]|uniref:Reverse transcriptase/retrotransposon-derived protein RNase H-like domain-containing protein n=1 Tax=Sesamum radiatum TaxID=300843 RepID=A0AAW2P2C9_SESRA
MVALSRFISKSIEKGLPFFKTLRKVKDFEWIKECQRAFKELKAYLAKLHWLVKSIPGDTLYLYISSTSQTVSSVLVREEDDAQTPIYYVSKVLNGISLSVYRKVGPGFGHNRKEIAPLLHFLSRRGQNQYSSKASPRQTRSI